MREVAEVGLFLERQELILREGVTLMVGEGFAGPFIRCSSTRAPLKSSKFRSEMLTF